MANIPVLTPEQINRFRKWLVSEGFAPSFFKSKLAVDSFARCYKSFCESTEILKNSPFDFNEITLPIADIVALYADYERNKHEEELKKSILEPNCVHKKPPVRGKQVKPVMKFHTLRLPEESLNQLKELGGNTSAHIRQAIEDYLKNGKNK